MSSLDVTLATCIGRPPSWPAGDVEVKLAELRARLGQRVSKGQVVAVAKLEDGKEAKFKWPQAGKVQRVLVKAGQDITMRWVEPKRCWLAVQVLILALRQHAPLLPLYRVHAPNSDEGHVRRVRRRLEERGRGSVCGGLRLWSRG